MDAGGSKNLRTRELPPLPQRGQRTLPPVPSQDAAGETRTKKRRVRKEASGGDHLRDPGMGMGGLGVRSESGVGGREAPPQRRRRRRRKASASDLEEDQADLVNGEAADQTTGGEEGVTKAKRKKKTKVVESQLPNHELDVEEDDIIAAAPPGAAPPGAAPPGAGPPGAGPQHPLSSAPLARSQPGGKVFVERSRRFQAAERSDWRKTSRQLDGTADSQHLEAWTPREVALRVHQGSRVLGLCCHGVLAGCAMWNVGVLYLLAGPQLGAVSNLLQQYPGLAPPAQSLLYLLLAVSTVAAFDRVNLARSSTALQELITLNPVALASVLYFSALVLSLSQQMTSDRIHLYPDRNATLWPPGSELQILHPWVTVNLVVAVLVGLAWILISTRPETDYTHEYLESMRLEPLNPEDQSEMTA